jgi:hypothetical protein
MKFLQNNLFSGPNEEYYQINAAFKFEIKQLEAYCHAMIHNNLNLSPEQLILLKKVYLTLAKNYEDLSQMHLNPNNVEGKTFNFSDVTLSDKEFKKINIDAKNAILEYLNVFEEARRFFIMANNRTDKINFMINMSQLCRKFARLLEEYLEYLNYVKSQELVNLKKSVAKSCNTSFMKNSLSPEAANKKLDSLFRFIA